MSALRLVIGIIRKKKHQSVLVRFASGSTTTGSSSSRAVPEGKHPKNTKAVAAEL